MSRSLLRIPLSEALIATLVVAISLVFFVEAFSFPHMRADPGGGALWPQIMAACAGGGSLVLLLMRLAGRGPARPTGPVIERKSAQIIFACVLYPLAIIYLGFTLSTALLTVVLMLLLKARFLEIILFTVALTAIVYGFFVYMLEAVVPTGLLIDRLFG
ncbi:tripartite tricarboxylate transporter TctB family protein [Acuticoccus kandeliae]|uniref:tripartite tricarboxylate transporter TctB family protein n=1 Tax=Acuticoccus kandeliae TaxID=2073160 RepID=UPI000D3E2657|nr:tripartite tricarboxylate transporter TctB family protein [Acuticoccus kandeliae]